MNIEPDDEIGQIRRRLAALESEQSLLRARLAELENPPLRLDTAPSATRTPVDATPAVTSASSSAEKIAFFRSLFAGRADVYPVRSENRKTGKSGYAPACANEWETGLCKKPLVKGGECRHQAFIPVSDEMIARRLRGRDGHGASNDGFVAGVYPLLPTDACWFLASDFDGDDWNADALAFLETCEASGVPTALERSRSGDGDHVWIFFSEPVPASLARQVGALRITATIERRPEIGFGSYDRFFPSRDSMPHGGFGNLIALPLQRRARENGNSLFVNSKLFPYDDQWAFLSAPHRLSLQTVQDLVDQAIARGAILKIRMLADEEESDEPWKLPPSTPHRVAPRLS